MSSINNVGGNSPVYSVNKAAARPPAAAPGAAQGTTSTRGMDKLELSGTTQLFKTLKAGGDVRADKVAEIKAQIANGTYEDDRKLDLATDRLLDDLL